MKTKLIVLILAIVLIVGSGCTREDISDSKAFVKPIAMSSYERIMRQDLLCIMIAYPEYVSGLERASTGEVYLIMKSGRKLIYDDKKIKNPEQKLANPDLQDMLEQPYPLTAIDKLMDKDFDPGRIRVYGILNEVYGESKKQIEAQLANVSVSGKWFQFSKSNKASEALKAVMGELIPLSQQSSRVVAAAFPSSGTFNYRYIANTNRLSPHAFGIAIDLARDKRDYWQWASREEGQQRLESYPKELVEVFEKHNFVWGGKWGHFDILHFEYRPEVIFKARYFGNTDSSEEKWYKGAPVEAPSIREYIIKIEDALK